MPFNIGDRMTDSFPPSIEEFLASRQR